MPDDEENAVLAAWRTLPRPEPPQSLDAAVLARARAEPAAAASGTATQRPTRWVGAFATAAVIVLAVALSWQLREQHPAALPGEALPGETAPDAAVAVDARPRSSPPNAAAVLPAQRILEPAPLAAPAAAPAPMPPAASAEAPPATAARGVGAETAAEGPGASADAVAAAPAVSSSVEPKTLPVEPAAGLTASRAHGKAAATDAEDPTAEGPVGATVETEDPERALAHIRALVALGELEAARRAARAFRDAHPQRALPDDLRFLLPDE